MELKSILLLFILSWIGLSFGERPLPENLLIGAGTAAYQIEGSWNVDGRTPCIWDHLYHDQNSCFSAECANGDNACKSYELYERDVEMIREIGLDFYRMSMSWTRILPYGFANVTSQVAIAHYNKIIDLLTQHNIKPIITIYHWDLPQVLQDLGGWANPNVIDWVSDFARVLFENFGDRVQTWITINEPKEVCLSGYGTGNFAPTINMTGVADYMCTKNILLTHANIYHMYDKEFRPTQNGKIGITLSGNWNEPASDSEDDLQASEDAFQFNTGLFAHPIFSEKGNWPCRVIERVCENSANEGFKRSRLPTFTQQQIDFIKGSADFLGFNHYTSNMVYRNTSLVGTLQVPSYANDLNVATYQPTEWVGNTTGWVLNVPWGFYKLLTRIRSEYNNPDVFITENGYAVLLASGLSDIYDYDRVKFHRDYLTAMLDAIDEGSSVIGYTVWSLMDNLSWRRGFRTRFGLYEVDMTSDSRPRTARMSAYVFKQLIKTRTLDLTYVPDMSAGISID